MIVIDTADARLLERNEARAYRVECGGLRNALSHDLKDRAIDGNLIQFDMPFPYGGRIVMFKPNSFGDLRNDLVEFRIDHINTSEVANTDGSFELMADEDGIQFRLDLERCKHGYAVARMCETDNRASMSVGCDILEEHDEIISGHSVRVVTRARLREASICKEGAAGDSAFAMVVDKTFTPKPVAGSRSATFNAAQALHRVSRKVRNLKAQIAATYDAPPPMRRSMTLDESNRLQTAETERLVAHSRKVHGIYD